MQGNLLDLLRLPGRLGRLPGAQAGGEQVAELRPLHKVWLLCLQLQASMLFLRLCRRVAAPSKKIWFNMTLAGSDSEASALVATVHAEFSQARGASCACWLRIFGSRSFLQVAPGSIAVQLSCSTMARPILLPLSLCVALVMLLKSSTFVQAPARTVEGPQQQLRVMETAALSTGIAMTNALPALATWSEGSEPGQNIDPDSTEAYNRKILNATAACSGNSKRSLL